MKRVAAQNLFDLFIASGKGVIIARRKRQYVAAVVSKFCRRHGPGADQEILFQDRAPLFLGEDHNWNVLPGIRPRPLGVPDANQGTLRDGYHPTWSIVVALPPIHHNCIPLPAFGQQETKAILGVPVFDGGLCWFLSGWGGLYLVGLGGASKRSRQAPGRRWRGRAEPVHCPNESQSDDCCPGQIGRPHPSIIRARKSPDNLP